MGEKRKGVEVCSFLNGEKKEKKGGREKRRASARSLVKRIRRRRRRFLPSFQKEFGPSHQEKEERG